MANEKEVQRLIGIAREHARAALAKPETQRESYLGFCRLNWKRYAAGISKNAAEGERFAAALDRATREFMALMQDPANAEPAEAGPPWLHVSADAVEGAMDSVVAYEVAIEPAPQPEPAPAASAEDTPELAAESIAEDAGAGGGIASPPLPEAVDPAEARVAEEEDRQTARFSFGGLVREQPAEPTPPRADPELKRKVQDLLRARQVPKTDEDGDA